jgi:hypothetical protein
MQNADTLFKGKAFDLNKIYKDPRQMVELFEQLQKNRYREMSRVRDFLDVAEKIYTKKEIYMNFKDRQNFGKDTMKYLFADKYRSSNLPSYKEFTSIIQKSYRKLKEVYPDVTFEELFPLILIKNFQVLLINKVRNQMKLYNKNLNKFLKNQKLHHYHLHQCLINK